MQAVPPPGRSTTVLVPILGAGLVLAGLLPAPTPVEAQPAASSAFQALLPTLQHPRCSNCHGGLDVFAANTTHPGGQISAPDEDNPFGGDCSGCHTAVPGGARWRQPAATDSARWTGKSPAVMCRAIKAGRLNASDMLDHVRNDALVTAGFAGLRGGASDQANPPPMSQPQFVAATQQWITAMGADKWSDPNAGCPALLAGAWSSQYGVAMLTQAAGAAVSGSLTYTNGNHGQLTGTFDGRTLTYSWSNPADHGDGRLDLSADGCTLNGYFTQASDGSRGDWTLRQSSCAAPASP